MGFCKYLCVKKLHNSIFKYDVYCYVIDLFPSYYRAPPKSFQAHSGHIYSCPGRVIQNSDIAVSFLHLPLQPSPPFLTICHLPMLPLFLTMFILSITIYSPFFSSIHIPSPPLCRELHLSSDGVRHLTLSQGLVS